MTPARLRPCVLLAMLGGTILLSSTAAAFAQTTPAARPITITAGATLPTTYFFRGIRQEFDPRITFSPYAEAEMHLDAGDGLIRGTRVFAGVWNSFHSGSSGSAGGSGRTYYEADFYTGALVTFRNALDIGGAYRAYTSRNHSFNTVHEVSVAVSAGGALAPYGLVAFELRGQADEGLGKGTYLELGIEPEWPILNSRVALAIPVKVGLSLKDYYETPFDEDATFGFLDTGVAVRVPFSGPAGVWTVHGDASVLTLGKTTRAFNLGDRHQIVASVGVTWSR